MLRNHRKRILIAFSVIILFIPSCILSPPREKRLPPENMGIIFEANLNGAQDIYRISDFETQAVERLTFTPDDFESFLLVSDDGRYASFVIHGPDRASPWDLYKLDLESLETSQINTRESGLPPTYPLGWAVGEHQILVPDYQGTSLYKIDLDNDSVEKVDLPSQRQIRPTHCQYSYDKKFVACDLFDKWTNPIISSYIYVLETKEEIQLGGEDEYCFQPEWSPAENKILLHCFFDTEDIARIYLYEIVEDDSSVYVRKIKDVLYANPSLRARVSAYIWSPDGKFFITTSSSINSIVYPFVIYNSDGSINKYISPSNITEDMLITDISWLPDGQNILYIAGKDEESLNIYMMDTEGLNNYIVTTQPANYSNLRVYSKP